VLDIEPELDESGAAGAAVDESVEGALGDVDSCLEQATMARALRLNRRRLRFMDHLTVSGLNRRGSFTVPGPVQRSVARGVPPQQSARVGKLEAPKASSRLRPEEPDYFLAAMRFFFLAGSFGRDLPNEPW
jgi:hypothetical protein